ncbi:carbohydrate ABC transporter permease [Sphaerisporangium krabiense]|uniref:ABC-type sugar transport system permease subunit n=1 Tax=Sphaerisporangium krabiense TaxID=763782 RepID=A0A7W9DPA6_9ACTN|nr:sugar ABC transporter permease [Sphaerisporangium krabiense]MBB5626183.1 ABC-type sugar transport system permease subunit [Sphaerisporangium krabiense]
MSRRDLVGATLSFPALALFALFAIYPGLRVFYLSLFDYSLTSPATFVGLENFRFLATDPRFHEALLNSLFYTVGTYLPALVLALMLAMALHRRMAGGGWIRLLYFLPVATSWVAISVVWRLVLHPHGLLNQTLGLDVTWLTSSAAAPWALVIMSVWKETGFFLILFLAGLSRLPREVFEAAQVDGAGAWRRFWHITFPLLKPVTAICSVMAIIRGLQAFSPQVVLTDGGFGTEVVNLFVYKTAFENARMGRASAVAVFMFFVLICVTLAQLRLFRREDA